MDEVVKNELETWKLNDIKRVYSLVKLRLIMFLVIFPLAVNGIYTLHYDWTHNFINRTFYMVIPGVLFSTALSVGLLKSFRPSYIRNEIVKVESQHAQYLKKLNT